MFDLPKPIPPRIAKLPRDHRGFPVPYFVQWMHGDKPCPHGEGVPDFRVIDTHKFLVALRLPRCWVCGENMGRHRVFSIGPMCAVNRVISEPPSHRECAEWSVKACPFLSKPRMKRNMKDIPEAATDAAGIHIDRNPGVTCLWETSDYRPFKPDVGGEGVLIRLGDPDRVDWWCEGRAATREEVADAIRTGLPELVKMAQQDGADAMEALVEALDRALPLLPGRKLDALTNDIREGVSSHVC